MPGSYEIRPVSSWEDDDVQFGLPAMGGGANKGSLIKAQPNYQDFDACDQHARQYVRPPAADEHAPWPDDLSVFCWWLPTSWRHDRRASAS
ncbi:hypothetical protein ADK93_34210 [Streptomyces sp. XY58]|nr:hypothetical protein ADK93_34210 [Streptomyces sp. XY58]KOV03774.1 hypothetical protein ADK89_26045 [Streptomyces sp. XY37]KOV48940.1 hypothetical protein ADK99_14565 [Streptomyces sp. MMG1064]